MRNVHIPALLWAASLCVGGCSIGYNSTLFVTNSNFGLNFDAAPPTLSLDVSRQEGVIGPTFEGGAHAPVAASFHADATALSGGVAATFAGGAAADQVSRSTDPGSSNRLPDGTVCLSAMPKVDLPHEGDVRPFVFMTDTSIGFKVSWSGVTAEVPDSVNLGFKRKDVAWAPVFGNAPGCPASKPYGVKMPSFLASVDTTGQAKGITTSSFSVNQFFATGQSAENLATRDSVRNGFLHDADQQFQKINYTNDSAACDINAWLGDPPDQQKVAQIRGYLQQSNLPAYDVFIMDSGQAANRANAMQALSIPHASKCNS